MLALPCGRCRACCEPDTLSKEKLTKLRKESGGGGCHGDDACHRKGRRAPIAFAPLRWAHTAVTRGGCVVPTAVARAIVRTNVREIRHIHGDVQADG